MSSLRGQRLWLPSAFPRRYESPAFPPSLEPGKGFLRICSCHCNRDSLPTDRLTGGDLSGGTIGGKKVMVVEAALESRESPWTFMQSYDRAHSTRKTVPSQPVEIGHGILRWEVAIPQPVYADCHVWALAAMYAECRDPHKYSRQQALTDSASSKLCLSVQVGTHRLVVLKIQSCIRRKFSDVNSSHRRAIFIDHFYLPLRRNSHIKRIYKKDGDQSNSSQLLRAVPFIAAPSLESWGVLCLVLLLGLCQSKMNFVYRGDQA